MQFLARRAKGITAKVEPNKERAEIIRVKTNARDPETINKRNRKGNKFEEAIIMRDKDGKTVKSSYVPIKVNFKDSRRS